MINTASTSLPAWLRELRAVAVALIDEDGRIVEANQGFLASLPPDTDSVVDHIEEPSFFRWAQCATGEDGAIFDGLIHIGADGIKRTFAGRIYRQQQRFLLVAEMDIAAFEKLSGELDGANRELDEIRRQLNRRNLALQKSLDDLKEARQQDMLTGLALKTRLFERMDEEILRWERYRRPLALIILDLDYFGAVNEEYGREVGDEILRHVATLTQQAIRSMDVAVRYGAQEFAVLLPETNEMGALIVADRLRMELESQIILPLVKPLTASLGVALLLEGENRREFCLRAERAVRHSKLNGRNRVTMAGVVDECDYVYQGTVKKVEGKADV